MIKPEGWILLAFEVPQMAQLIAPPKKEPTTPNNIVASKPIESLPGMINRANKPATKPMIKNQTKLNISVPPSTEKS